MELLLINHLHTWDSLCGLSFLNLFLNELCMDLVKFCPRWFQLHVCGSCRAWYGSSIKLPIMDGRYDLKFMKIGQMVIQLHSVFAVFVPPILPEKETFVSQFPEGAYQIQLTRSNMLFKTSIKCNTRSECFKPTKIIRLHEYLSPVLEYAESMSSNNYRQILENHQKTVTRPSYTCVYVLSVFTLTELLV